MPLGLERQDDSYLVTTGNENINTILHIFHNKWKQST